MEGCRIELVCMPCMQATGEGRTLVERAERGAFSRRVGALRGRLCRELGVEGGDIHGEVELLRGSCGVVPRPRLRLRRGSGRVGVGVGVGEGDRGGRAGEGGAGDGLEGLGEHLLRRRAGPCIGAVIHARHSATRVRRRGESRRARAACMRLAGNQRPAAGPASPVLGGEERFARLDCARARSRPTHAHARMQYGPSSSQRWPAGPAICDPSPPRRI